MLNRETVSEGEQQEMANEPPKPQLKSHFESTLIVVTIHGLVLVGVIGVTVFVVPKFEEIFKGFDAELPVITKVVIRVSVLVKRFFVLVPLLAAILLAADALIYYQLRRSFGMTWSGHWRGLVTLILGATVFAVALATFLPLFRLMRGVVTSAGD